MCKCTSNTSKLLKTLNKSYKTLLWIDREGRHSKIDISTLEIFEKVLVMSDLWVVYDG